MWSVSQSQLVSRDVDKHSLAKRCPLIAVRQEDTSDGTCCPREDKAKGTHVSIPAQSSTCARFRKYPCLKHVSRSKVDFSRQWRLCSVQYRIRQQQQNQIARRFKLLDVTLSSINYSPSKCIISDADDTNLQTQRSDSTTIVHHCCSGEHD